LLLTLGAVAADQFFVPTLYSSSPLWATTVCLLLVWRRSDTAADGILGERPLKLSRARISLFLAAHAGLLLTTVSLKTLLPGVTGGFTSAGWLLAASKVSVLAPTLLLFPLGVWRKLARVYTQEGFAALLALFTFLPTRWMEALWPWYSQILGRSVQAFAQLFVPALTYHPGLTPTLVGSELDVTILYSCSGINGIELFQLLFAFMVILEWNRLRKDRALAAYFAGLLAMLVANALRISLLIILGNHGFSTFVLGSHISAGWIFFSAAFLTYLLLVYRHLIIPEVPRLSDPLSFADIVQSPTAG